MKRTFRFSKCLLCTDLRSLLLLLCAQLFFGCERRELTYDYAEGVPVSINIDWSTLKASEEKPAHMKAMFYPTNGDKPIERYLMNSDGEKVYVPEGDYNIIVYNWRTNAESQTVQFRNHEGYLTHEAYTAEVSRSKWRTKASDPIIAQPDHLYSWSTGETPVQVIASKSSGGITIVPRVENKIRYYQFKIDIYNPNEIRNIEGVIEGVHGWMRLATDERSDNSYSADLSITRFAGSDNTKATFLLTFWTFGVIDGQINNIVIDTINPDGVEQIFTKDLSEIIFKIDNGELSNAEPIGISNPEDKITIIPGKSSQSGGFSPPTVDDWNEEHGGNINV